MAIIVVPDDQPTIQLGLNALVAPGDICKVRQGIYVEGNLSPSQ